MKRLHLISWCLGLGILAALCVLMAPTPAMAAEGGSCSSCDSCSSCNPGTHGGNSCTYSGGCCNETGGNCNPTLALNQLLLLKPSAIYQANTSEGVLDLAKVNEELFVAWSCEAQEFVGYRQLEDGRFELAQTSVVGP